MSMLLFTAMMLPAYGQYDRAVVALTRLDYVYYNIDNPMSVSVPGLMPKDLLVYIGEDPSRPGWEQRKRFHRQAQRFRRDHRRPCGRTA